MVNESSRNSSSDMWRCPIHKAAGIMGYPTHSRPGLPQVGSRHCRTSSVTAWGLASPRQQKWFSEDRTGLGLGSPCMGHLLPECLGDWCSLKGLRPPQSLMSRNQVTCTRYSQSLSYPCLPDFLPCTFTSCPNFRIKEVNGTSHSTGKMNP